MKITISIPDALYAAAERLAKESQLSRDQLYTQALSRFLEPERSQGVTSALNAVYGEASGIDPILGQIQHASLPTDDW